MNIRLYLVLLLTSSFLFARCRSDSPVAKVPVDSVVYSFVVVGCNRVEKGDADQFKNPSTANVVQLSRTFADVAALSPKPDLFFFAGDMVLGYTDSFSLSSELKAWTALYESSPMKAAGIEMIAIPGNHESEDFQKEAEPYNERVWLDAMAPYIKRGGNGPKADPKGPDSLISDQSFLNYSFDLKDAHFVVISTDPAGRDWQPPAHWIASDVAAAHANPKIKHIFAIGHKPAYPWDYKAEGGKNDGLNAYPENRDIMWRAFDDNNTDAMIAAHNHVYSAFRPTNKTWMIIAGNGGSKLEKNVKPQDQYYGFTLIEVLKSGNVVEKSYGRNFGASYLDSSSVVVYPTKLRDSIMISKK